MKFRCQQSALSHAINIVQKAISSKTPLPILSGILLEAKDGLLKLTTNNLIMGIEKTIPAVVIDSGSTVISAKILGEFVRKLPSEEINCTLEHQTFNLKCLDSEVDFLALNPKDFPEVPSLEQFDALKINTTLFKDMIRQTSFAISQDDSRPILTGVLMDIKDQQISFVAIDGFRVAIRQAKLSEHFEKEIVVPGKTLNDINKIIDHYQDEKNIVLSFNDKHIVFSLGDTRIVSRLLEGDYLKYQQMLPSHFSTSIEVNTEALLQAIERTSLFAKVGNSNAIKLSIKDNKMHINAVADIGSSNEKVSILKDGLELNIGFNPKYLTDVLKVIDSEKVSMFFSSAIAPCIIKSTTHMNYTYLAVPLRLPNL